MLMEMHLVFMHSHRIGNCHMIRKHSTLHRKHSCGWRSTVMIQCIRAITNICIETEPQYKELQTCLQMRKQDIRTKTVLFICSKHLPNYMLCGQTICYANVCRKCCCSSVTQ